MTKVKPGSLCLLAMVLCLALPASAQDEEEERVLEPGKFYPTFESGVTITQSAFSDNWAGGDQGSVVWTGIANAGLESQLKPRVHWNNTLKLAFGQTHQQRQNNDGTRRWEKPLKSTDQIDYETIFRFTQGWPVDPFVSARFETQFQDASDQFGRNLMFNPLRIKESAGLARKIIDEENRSLLSRVGFTIRQFKRKLFTDQDPTDGLLADTESEGTNDGGFEWVTDYKAKVLEDRVSWTSKLTLFQPVFSSVADEFDMLTAAQFTAAGLDTDLRDFAKTADIDFENVFTSQITSVISVQLYLRWLYDKYDDSVKPLIDADTGELTNVADVGAGIRKAGQLKQTLAIGITYRFF